MGELITDIHNNPKNTAAAVTGIAGFTATSAGSGAGAGAGIGALIGIIGDQSVWE